MNCQKCRSNARCLDCMERDGLIHRVNTPGEDPLRPARGIVWGVVISVILWCIVIPLVLFFNIHV